MLTGRTRKPGTLLKVPVPIVPKWGTCLERTTAVDSGGAPEGTKQSGEKAVVQGGGTMVAGTGGSSWTGIT